MTTQWYINSGHLESYDKDSLVSNIVNYYADRFMTDGFVTPEINSVEVVDDTIELELSDEQIAFILEEVIRALANEWRYFCYDNRVA